MLRFDIEEKKSFEFAIGDENYAIPAFGELPADLTQQLMDAFAMEGDTAKGIAISRAFIDILDEFTPGVSSKLTSAQVRQLMDAWDELTEDTTGAKLGE